VDFFLRLEHIVVAAKMARSDWGAHKLREQLAVDGQHYKQLTGCNTLACFVYDPAGRFTGPRAVESALSRETNGLTVRVIITPKRM
jgi:hypothetical protein